MKKRLCTVLLLLSTLSLFAAEEKITVAIFTLENKTGIDAEQAEQITNYLSRSITSNPIFNVVEREKIQKVFEEQNFQLSGMVDDNQIIEFGKMLAAQQLLMGSVGKLFGKIVISLKLVSAESGQIILADTIYTEEKQIFEDLDRLGTTVTNNSIDSRREVDVQMIRQLIDKKNYIEAKKSLDLYIRENDLDTDAQAFWDEIIPYLTDEYYRQAEKQRKSKNFGRAKEYINLAISLSIEEKYFQLRDRIYLEEEMYIKEKQEQEELARLRKEEQQLREREYIGVNPVEEYYWGIQPHGVHLGVSNQWFLPENLTLPSDFGNWGADLLITHIFFQKEKKNIYVDTRNLAYAGLSINYEKATNNTLILNAYISPFIAAGFKVVNLVLTIGADAGVQCLFSDAYSNGTLWGFSTGGTVVLDLKAYKTLGIYGSMKMDYLFYPDLTSQNGFQFRISTGIVF